MNQDGTATQGAPMIFTRSNNSFAMRGKTERERVKLNIEDEKHKPHRMQHRKEKSTPTP